MTGNNNAKDKIQAISLAALMVFSVFTMAAGFAGTAAANAPEPGQHAANSGPGDVTTSQDINSGTQVEIATIAASSSAGGSGPANGNVRNVTVNPGFGSSSNGISTGDIESITVVVEDANNNRVSNTTSYDQSTVNLSFAGTLAAQGSNTSLVQVFADTSNGISNGDDIDAGIRIQAPDGGVYEGTSPYDTAGVQTVIANTGFISGSVTSSNTGASLDDVPVEVYRDTDGSNDITPSDTLVTTVQTNNNGVYTAQVAPGTNEYLLRVDQTGFQSFASAPLTVNAGQTTNQNIVLAAQDVATNIDAQVQGDSTVPADGQSTVTHLVNLTGRIGQQTDQPLPGRTVNVDVSRVGGSSGSITIDGTTTVTPPSSPSTVSTTVTTNSTGKAAINVSSNTVQQLEVTFSYTNATGTTLSDTESANFAEIINDGPGSVRGNIGNALTGDSIEGASVYAIQQSRFSQNTQAVGSVTISTYDSNDQTVAFRLINDDTGQIVDADQYRVEKTDTDDRLVKSYPLNESDSAADNGFVYTDIGNDDDASFDITPLQSGNYTLDVAPGSPPSNAGFEATINVTTFSSSSVNLDLTQSAIESRYDETSAIVSDTTDSSGEFTLTQLFIGQDLNGIDYVVTATDSSFTRDYVTTTVTDNDPAQAFIDIEPREPQPADTVNITNVATIPSGDVSGTEDTFDNTSDSFRQDVPRDGRTLDVIQVETSNNAGAANGTVTLNLNAATFDGSEGGFLNDAGTNVGTQTTVATGNDGVATVYLRSDASSSDVNGNITANLAGATGSTATDVTNKTFVGVTDFESGSISGLVTNSSDVALPDSLVYVDQFDYGTAIGNSGQEEFRFDIEPVQDPEDVSTSALEFDITYQQFNTSTQQYETVGTDSGVPFTTLTSGQYQFGAFDDVSAATSVGDGFELATNTDGDASYTLEPVPATGTVDYTVTGVKLSAPDAGTAGSALTQVQVGITGTANIVIPGAQPTQPAQFQVSGLSPTDVTVTQGDNITVSANVENVGTATATQTIEFRVGGNTVASQSVTLDGGNSTTVTFENVSTANLAPGSYTHGVFSQADSQTATLTVESDSSNGGQVTEQDVITAIVEFNSGGDITEQEVIDLIVEFNAQN